MYNLDNLKAALMRRREAQKAYHDHSAKLMTDDDSALQHDILRRAYDDAAHSVAFHADIFMDAWEISTQLNGEQPASQPDNIFYPHEGDTPHCKTCRADLLYCRCPDGLLSRAQLNGERLSSTLDAYPPSHPGFQPLLKSIEQHDPLLNDPACSTGQIAFDALMHETFGPQDENQDPDSSSEWTEPATDEDLSWQSSESGDLFDDYDDDEDEWPEQAVSTSIHIGKDGHIKIVEGVLSRYKGEDWGEASGWHQTTVEMDDLTTEAEQKVREWCKDKEPGTYDVPYELIDEIELVEPLDYDDLEDDDEEEEEPVHAILEPFGDGKCHCPYCNAECAPDYCSGCQSTLTPPAIKPEIRTDLPDEPPF